MPFLFAVLFHGVYNYFELFRDDFRQYFAYVVVLIALFECKIQYADLKSKFEELSLVNTDNIIKGEANKMNEEKKSFWKRIIQDNRVSVTFDLYECGLVFFDDRPKNHYKLLLR